MSVLCAWSAPLICWRTIPFPFRRWRRRLAITVSATFMRFSGRPSGIRQPQYKSCWKQSDPLSKKGISMIRSTIYTKSISTNIIVIQWRTTIGTISIFSISLNLRIAEVLLIGHFLQFSRNNFCCIKTV